MIKGRTFVNVEYWKFSLSLSLPLVGYSIASQILSVSDRMMISSMVNNSAVGIYSTIYSVSSLFTMVWTAVNASFVPYLYENIDKKDNSIRKISFSLLFVYAMIAIMMVFLAPEIVKILATDEYYEAIYIMPPIAAGVFMTSVANMYSNILLYTKSSIHIMIASCIAAVANLILNYTLIPIFGYMAAAYTTMFAYILMLLVLIVFANRSFLLKEKKSLNIIYDNKKIYTLSVLTILILLLGIELYQFTVLRYLLSGLLGIAIISFSLKVLKKKNNYI
ncbi:lipopolysaccharide biosynthesis protein [Caproicibacterium sp. NSD3]